HEQDPVLVNARVATLGTLPAPPEEPSAERAPPAAPLGARRVYLAGWREVPVFEFGALAAAQVLDGPAIVESQTTTVLLRAGDRATVTRQGWLDIALPGAG
ncbi:MAG: hypothetical protein R3357_14335, partial [Burkholderiales bacterium]|nr:hypothetical protein [Burkholderiales bacterium]